VVLDRIQRGSMRLAEEGRVTEAAGNMWSMVAGAWCVVCGVVYGVVDLHCGAWRMVCGVYGAWRIRCGACVAWRVVR
jgi:hypothetical protein